MYSLGQNTKGGEETLEKMENIVSIAKPYWRSTPFRVLGEK